jgi:AbrB family looped-hinge helix DNA binding protein
MKKNSTTATKEDKNKLTIKIGSKNKITIPSEIFKTLDLKQGDFLEALITEDKSILLVPKSLVPKDQNWFWTKEWQKKEHEANQAIAKGELCGPYDTAEQAIEALDNEKS